MDISQITDGLYVASSFYPPDEDMPPQAVMLDVTDGITDGPLSPKAESEFLRFAVTTQVLRDQGYNVVLRCDAGRNRSPTVAALCLIEDGLSPQEAVDAVRDARQHLNGEGALTNRSFVAFLLRQS